MGPPCVANFATMNTTPIITGLDYWQGRDSQYRMDWSEEIKRNADDLLLRVNLLLPFMVGVDFEAHPVTRSLVSSGWRPPSVNAGIPNAAPRSKHMTGQAIDLYDPDGDLDAWCWNHSDILSRPEIDLYQEHPSATRGWLHLQSVPPKSQAHYPIQSRRRWFYP